MPNTLPFDSIAVGQTVLIALLGWLVSIARQTLLHVKQLNGRLVAMEAWRLEHDKSDERRFEILERDMRMLRWSSAAADHAHREEDIE